MTLYLAFFPNHSVSYVSVCDSRIYGELQKPGEYECMLTILEFMYINSFVKIHLSDVCFLLHFTSGRKTRKYLYRRTS